MVTSKGALKIGDRFNRELMQATEIQIGIEVRRVGMIGGAIERHSESYGTLRREMFHGPGLREGCLDRNPEVIIFGLPPAHSEGVEKRIRQSPARNGSPRHCAGMRGGRDSIMDSGDMENAKVYIMTDIREVNNPNKHPV
jgi:hypothetical protein